MHLSFTVVLQNLSTSRIFSLSHSLCPKWNSPIHNYYTKSIYFSCFFLVGPLSDSRIQVNCPSWNTFLLIILQKILNISHNAIRELPSSFFDKLRQLVGLDVSYNLLETLPSLSDTLVCSALILEFLFFSEAGGLLPQHRTNFLFLFDNHMYQSDLFAQARLWGSRSPRL